MPPRRNLWKFISSQFSNLPLSTADLSGRTAIVTGSNVGLGLEAARHLAKMNPKKLILACRNQEKGERAVRYINETTNVAPGIVEMWQLDLASFDSVKAFAKRAETELDRLDILIENAGIATRAFRRTSDGWEQTLQTNVLCTFLLAVLLLPLMRKTTTLSDKAPRLVILSSGVHTWTTIADYRAKPNIFEAMNDESQFIPGDRYPASKFLDTLLTRELTKHLTRPEDKKISISGINPGFCRTELRREANSWTFSLMQVLFGRTPEMGSRTLVHAAVGSDGENWKGEYLSDCRNDDESVNPFLLTEEGKETGARVWREMMDILRKVAPEVDKIIS